MQKLDYVSEDYSINSPSVGLIVLQTDEVMEDELRHWLPDNMRIFHTRIPNAANVTPDTLSAMANDLPNVVSLLPLENAFDVIVYGCTSASTVIGEERVAELIRQVIPDVAVTNPLTAVKAQLDDLGAKRIGLLTPYIPSVSLALQEKLQDHGMAVTAAASFHEENDHQVCRISAESISRAIVDLGSNDDVDAVFASCTNLRLKTILDDVSKTIGKPVISSNSALAWHVQELVG